MFWRLIFAAILLSNIESLKVEECDNGTISFDGNLEKCATQPLHFLGDFNCAFFWHDNCGICDENPDFSKQNFQYDASAVVVRDGCVATACHGLNFSGGCADFGPGYHNFWFAKQLTSGNVAEGIDGPHSFNDRVKSAKCHCTNPTTTTPPSTTATTTVPQKVQTIDISNIKDNEKLIYNLDILLIPKTAAIKPTKNTILDY
uniref:Secreted protein n=1 Tax=Panagrolaimus sp. ES5 TaxID=591445 RepID=A0AC34F8M3_9BILA